MRPNILWIMTDEQRTDSLGAYGSPWAVSPHLDELAAKGVRFASAYTPSPVCVAARGSILTGKACSRIGVLNNHHRLDPQHARFLTHEFSRAGYQVASFGKHHYNCPVKAFDREAGRVLDDKVGYFGYATAVDSDDYGMVRYPSDRRPWIFAGRFPGTVDETAEALNVRDALDWLEQRDTSRPFLLRVSVNAPHTPVVAPAPFDTMIDPASIDLSLDSRDDLELPTPVRDHLCEAAGAHALTPKQIARTRQCYYGRTAFLDELLGRLLDEMRAVGALDNTIIAFVSDHGTHLGDHGFYQKQSFYEASVAVPFLLAGPGIAEGDVARTPVNIGSLLPTLLDLAGLDVPSGLDFASLASVAGRGDKQPVCQPVCEPASRQLAATEDRSTPVISEIDFGVWNYRDGDRYVMIRDGDWKLAVFRDPYDASRFAPDEGVMLHNLRDDPGERRNLAADSEHVHVRERLIGAIDESGGRRLRRGGVQGAVRAGRGRAPEL